MKKLSKLILAAALLFGFAMPCFSQAQFTVTISQVEVNYDLTNASTYGSDVIFVRGTFTPALPCAVQGFFLTPTDAFLNQMVATLLLAKATGKTITYTHVYCHSNGYSRGNSLILN